MRIIENIKSSNLLKVISLNSFSVLAKIIAGFISIKVISIFLNPSALALLGNFKNFTAIVQRISSLGFQEGIVKYISENRENQEQTNQIASTAFLATWVTSLVLGICIFLFSVPLSDYIFKSNEFSFAFKFFGLLLPLYATHILLIAILNGLKEFKSYVSISILASIVGVLLSVGLIWKLNLNGAILSLAVTESVIVVISLYFFFRKKVIELNISKKFFSKAYLKNFFSYSSMAVITAIMTQFCSLYIRKHVINTIGMDEAGYWETLLRISNYYLMFIASGIGLYYLPRLTELKDNWSFKKEIGSYLSTLLPLCLLLFIGIFFTKKWVILILLNEEFLPVTDLFFWQLIGDFLKIASLAFAYQFLAKKMMKEYFITEISYFVVYYISSIYFTNLYGIQGVVIGYAVSYLFYLTSMLIIFRKTLLAKKPTPKL